MEKEQQEKNYSEGIVIDCPWCGHEKPDHSCGNCYSEMSQEDCWKCQGYCSEKCSVYIKEELPKIIEQKINSGIKCSCNEKLCGKCLGGNCEDDNCPTHTNNAKKYWKQRNNK